MRVVMETVSLANHFLIAMPAMADPSFSRTLTYICEHNADGAIGIIVNRPTDMNLANLFERVDINLEAGEWQSSLTVNSEIALTSSRDILLTMGNAAVPAQVLVSLGYAGWTAGQLEWELAQNAWLTVEADPDIIFDLPPEQRLPAAMQSLGVDFANLSEVAGHA